MNYWEEIAEKVAEDFGVMVDYEDRFFVCPECGEPIYEDDWKESGAIVSVFTAKLGIARFVESFW